MIFPKHTEGGLPGHEPFIVPIAIPAMAGPGSITTVMIYAKTFEHAWETSLVILLAIIPSLFFLLLASNIKYLVGEKGLLAFERLGGLLICFIAIQMITSGMINIVKENFPANQISQVIEINNSYKH